MIRTVYAFKFGNDVEFASVEHSLLISTIAIEGLHGRAALRCDLSIDLNHKSRTLSVEGESQIGYDLAKILTCLFTKEFGEGGFEIKRSEERVRSTDPLFVKGCLL